VVNGFANIDQVGNPMSVAQPSFDAACAFREVLEHAAGRRVSHSCRLGRRILAVRRFPGAATPTLAQIDLTSVHRWTCGHDLWTALDAAPRHNLRAIHTGMGPVDPQPRHATIGW
jgi:hypothetical protein